MLKKISFVIVTILIPFAVHAENAGTVISVDTIQLVKISAPDQRAVVKTPGGKMQVIKIGDTIGENARVVEITGGRIVLENSTPGGPETVIIRLEKGKQNISRIRKSAPRQTVRPLNKVSPDQK